MINLPGKNRAMKTHKPWIMRLPAGLRKQPAWIFIGLLIGFAGLSYVGGFTESSVSRAVGTVGLRVWGAVLTFSGFAVVLATLRAHPALEKLALRTLSICMAVYGGWLTLDAELNRIVMSIVLLLILIVLAEIRVAVLKMLLGGGHDVE